MFFNPGNHVWCIWLPPGLVCFWCISFSFSSFVGCCTFFPSARRECGTPSENYRATKVYSSSASAAEVSWPCGLILIFLTINWHSCHRCYCCNFRLTCALLNQYVTSQSKGKKYDSSAALSVFLATVPVSKTEMKSISRQSLRTGVALRLASFFSWKTPYLVKVGTYLNGCERSSIYEST